MDAARGAGAYGETALQATGTGMEQAGAESKAKSIVFSLPVTDTAGLRLIED